MTRILLFGAGSIGGIYVYILSKGGADVTAVCRSNYAVVKERGFRITSPKFGDYIFKPNAVNSVEDAKGPWDYIVVCSKSFPGKNPSLADQLRSAVGPETTIVLIQNGVGIESEIATAFPNNPILSCVVYLPTTQTSPGVILMREADTLEISTFPASAPESHKKAAQEFANVVTAGGGRAVLYDDIQPRRWLKLLINASWNPICALSRSTDADFLRSSPQSVDYVRSVMKEIVTLARALGYVEVNEAIAESQLNRALNREKGIQVSMLADALDGRSMEVEAILGNPVRIARSIGVETPQLEVLYILTKALDDSFTRLQSAAS
ncbi:2-dehydropantoate 2-reductase [Xylogone sp. PMI_703]|nr:2-dehydropantoate 2-reductase [Xylogone sp. PMI_703]